MTEADEIQIKTDDVMTMLAREIDGAITDLAGRPLPFILIVADEESNETAITGCGHPEVLRVMLERALVRVIQNPAGRDTS